MRPRIERRVLIEMATLLLPEDRDEMAIPAYLHRNPALRWMAWRRLDALAQELPALLPEGGRVMDYGCGTGVLFETLLQRANQVYGVDLVLQAARLWKDRRQLDGVTLYTPQQAMDAIPSGSLDLVVAAEVLEHVDDIGALMGFFWRVLSPQGTLLVSLPTENRAYKLGRKLAGFDGHYHKLDAHGIDQRIQEGGFSRTHRHHVPAPGPLSIYWIARYSPDPSR